MKIRPKRIGHAIPAGSRRAIVWVAKFQVLTIVCGLLLTSPRAGSSQATVTLSGEAHDDQVQPLTRVPFYLLDLSFTPCCREESHFFTETDGSFRIEVPPALYTIGLDAGYPYQLSRARVDARAGDVSGIVLKTQKGPLFYAPDSPPRASLIDLSTADASGEVTIIGRPGSVPSESFVFFVTLDTGHFEWTEASGEGSFEATLFAPPGSSVLIKADPFGDTLKSMLLNLQAQGRDDPDLPGGREGAAGALSGTILRVATAPPADGTVPFGGAGQVGGHEGAALPVWSFEGRIDRSDVALGETVRIEGIVEIVSPLLAEAGAMDVHVTLGLERLAGPDGYASLSHNAFASVLLTPTGLPIERQTQDFLICVEQSNCEEIYQAQILELTKTGTDRAQAVVDAELSFPPDLPAGYYRPRLVPIGWFGVPTESPPSQPVLSVDATIRGAVVDLPIIRVGDPPPPRLFWTLLTDTPSNGSRGQRAVEDRHRFGLATRILTQSEEFVVPRTDAASGQALSYRLEPFAPTLSRADRASPPPPPGIPFRFPSGQLTVTVERPDGGVDVLGPSPFVQSRVRSIVDRYGNLPDTGGGHLTEVFQLSTMDPRFEYEFAQDGLHVIRMEGTIDDVWGNTWTSSGTYEVHVGRILSLDTAVLPGTPFETGDVLNPGLVLTPPVPAEVKFRFLLATGSDGAQTIEHLVEGRANRFGYFQASDSGIVLESTGEYRVDVTAQFADPTGNLWMGARTWGGVVAPRDPALIAHGRRGIDEQEEGRQQWFFRSQTGIPKGGNHAFMPFHSGDVAWLEEDDSVNPELTFQDPQGSVAQVLVDRSADVFLPIEDRVSIGEIPLFSTRPDHLDLHLDPSKVDLWGYFYVSVQRPLVRVREELAEAQVSSLYWRFSEQYAGQIGVGPEGDLPGDIKFQYGGVVLRGPAVGEPQYAIYGSLFVLVPEEEPNGGGTRTFPPFQGNGGGPSGGPLLTLKGREFDLFLHPTAIRPGSVLEVGDAFAFSGAVGPPLPARVSYRVAGPDSNPRDFSGRASRIGYYYRPEDDFIVVQPGLYTVDVEVLFDGLTSAGQVTPPFPTGDLLGTANGSFSFYVVEPDSDPLELDLPREEILSESASFDIQASSSELAIEEGHVTVTIPGYVLESRELLPVDGGLRYSFKRAELTRDFPMLDPSDVVQISLFASGTSDGKPAHAARVISLHGQELFNTPQIDPCEGNDQTLCLNRERFQVEVEWRDFDGKRGSGQVVPFGSDDSGLLWFFDSENWEMLVKVLDGCAFNDHFWVFSAATTNVEYTLRVTDSATGESRSYFNPLGTAAAAITDTEALATCSVSAPGTAIAPPPISLRAAAPATAPHLIDPGAGGGCTPSSTNLCLNDTRFRVEVEWRDFEGKTGSGQVVPFGSDDSGLLWFFDSENWEMLVKVLDGCAFNDHFWVFSAATTNVGYTLRVTDTETDTVKEYTNPLGSAATAVTDTSALPTCP